MASRFGYGEALVELGDSNDRVVAVGVDVTGSTGVNLFADKFPGRFIQLGIAEQNALTVSSGLALSGLVPFVCGYSAFILGRAWDQIRNSVCYPDLNVKIAGSHSGVTVGPDGATHQAIEEISLLRVLPNMKIIVPCDYEEAKQATHAMAAIQGPVFIRLCRVAMPIITSPNDKFEFGKARVLSSGNDVAIIACGNMVYESLVSGEMLAKEGIQASVINVHTIKPLDEETIVQTVRRCGCAVTAEEHQIAGGLGGTISELLAKKYPVPMEMIGINDVFGESGEPEELLKHFSLKAEDICVGVRNVLKRKKSSVVNP
ncbi:MAG: transketolase C-terminal domain-containing protein [bacterium]